MDVLTPFIEWISQYKEVIENEELRAAAKLIAVIVTLVFSSITFYLKLKDRKAMWKSPALSWSETSWDAASGFPIYPLPSPWKGAASFPFIAADLSTRNRSMRGWFTSTDLRIWNSGGGNISGPTTNPTAAVFLNIEKGVGPYEISGCMSNDASRSFNLGRPTHSIDSGRQRIPIYFDLLRPGKGILVSIRHNSADGALMYLSGSSNQISSLTWGIHNVFRPRVVAFMDRLNYLLLVPSAVVAALLFYVGNTWVAIVAVLFTWMLISSVNLSRNGAWAPQDLTWTNKNAKVL